MNDEDYNIDKQEYSELSFLEDDPTLIDDDYELIGYGYESSLKTITKRENIAVSTLLVVASIAFTSSTIYIICIIIIHL